MTRPSDTGGQLLRLLILPPNGARRHAHAPRHPFKLLTRPAPVNSVVGRGWLHRRAWSARSYTSWNRSCDTARGRLRTSEEALRLTERWRAWPGRALLRSPSHQPSPIRALTP